MGVPSLELLPGSSLGPFTLGKLFLPAFCACACAVRGSQWLVEYYALASTCLAVSSYLFA